jgi:hypothetical protein
MSTAGESLAALQPSDYALVLNGSGAHALLFTYPNCGVCEYARHELRAVIAEYADRVRFWEVSLRADCPLAQRFDVSSAPMLIVVRSGVRRAHFLGQPPVYYARRCIEAALK